MRQPSWYSRAAYAAGLVAVFLMSAVSQPSAQSGTSDYVMGYHLSGSRVSRVSATTGEWIGASTTTGGDFRNIYPHPSANNPGELLGVVPGTRGVARLRPSDGVPVSKLSSQGTVKSGVYVNKPPLQQHYFTVGEYGTGGTNSSIIEFYSPNMGGFVEAFLPSGSQKIPNSCAYASTTIAGPFYRWFWTDREPQGQTTGLEDTIFCLSLTDTEVQQGSVIDPWNPTPGIAYGPPFPTLPSQIGSKVVAVDSYFGNDDDNNRIAVWTDVAGVLGAAGQNFLILIKSTIVAVGPLYGPSMNVYDADAPVLATGLLVEDFPIPSGIPSTTPDVVKDLKVFGNYAFMSVGKVGNSSGGTHISAWHIPTGIPISVPVPNCTGIGVNASLTKFYVGLDESYSSYMVGDIISVGLNGFDIGGAFPVANLTTQDALNASEKFSPNPPSRPGVGADWVSYVSSNDPLLSFPGQSQGSYSGRGDGGACSGSVVRPEPASAVMGLALVVVLAWLASAVLREASKRA